MNLSIFSSKLIKMKLHNPNFKSIDKKPIVQSLLVTTALVGAYTLLGSLKILKASPGVNQWQTNVIKIQSYADRQHSNINLALVGSSLTANIPADRLGDRSIDLALNGGCAQTGLAVIIKQTVKPKVLLVEINQTIARKVDKQLIESNYNPILYTVRGYFPGLREEYKPSSQIVLRVEELRHKFKTGNRAIAQQPERPPSTTSGQPNLTGQLLAQAIERNAQPLSAQEKTSLRTEAEYIKSQISEIERGGTQVILFNVPGDHQLEQTIAVKQSQAFMKELFPDRDFDWMPAPPARKWVTGDGVHLIKSDAIIYADFLRDRLKTSMQRG
jgi:hypothetical protein